ncbi:hypothetical protein STEG23_015773 [Scotinomys teguina]
MRPEKALIPTLMPKVDELFLHWLSNPNTQHALHDVSVLQHRVLVPRMDLYFYRKKAQHLDLIFIHGTPP